jgi:pimeloyl-ACP methyl ester carboxylesterase
VIDAALGAEEAPNKLADAAPGAEEPEPPDANEPPFGNLVPRPVDNAELAAGVLVGVVLRTVVVTLGSVVPTGSVVVTRGSVVLTGSVVVTFGSVVVTRGSVVLTGSVVVTFGSVVVTIGTVVLTGSVVVTFGSVVVTIGSVVLIGSVVVIGGSVVGRVRAGTAERPSTAVLATKPKRSSVSRGAADLTTASCPIRRVIIPLSRKPPRLARSHMTRLTTGAEMRVTGATDRAAVVCVNGGQGGEVDGTWSASIEWLVRRLAPRMPELGFAEVKYRIKSWKRMDWCVADAHAAVRETGAPRTLLLGFSMGGAVAIQAATEPTVEAVVGLAPWIPDRLDVGTLRGKRFDVLHGMLDRNLPGIPGVSPASSRRGFERAQALGVPGGYKLISGALHGIALRAGPNRLVPLPRAGVWARLIRAELERFQASAD